MLTNTQKRQIEILILDATIYDGNKLVGETSIAIDKGVIVELGADELQTKYEAGRTISVGGAIVTPGFVDSHVHTVFGGLEALRCDLTACENAEETLATIAKYAKEHPEEPWILGGGWSMGHFAGGTPRREDLDAVVPDRPVYLFNADHHGAWANTKAFELAGVTAATPDPVDGRIERDADGTPSGTLQEGAAELVGSILSVPSSDELLSGLLKGQEELFKVGVTGWQDAILGDYGGYTDMTPVYRRALDEGVLKAEVGGALWVSRDFDGMSIREFVEDLSERRAKFGGRGLNLNNIKIMVDGVAENETAALETPYVGECECTKGVGLAYFSREDLLEIVPQLNDLGFNVHFHAIGDRAVRYALDAVTNVAPAVRSKVRNHIAHIQIMNPADVLRFKELNVTANMQMLWACLDEQMETLGLPVLGEERAGWQYLFGSLYENGTALACGSDWPVSTPDPWQAIHVAVNRRAADDPEKAALLIEQALPLNIALAAYTSGSADLLGYSGGEITAGEVANLAIANRNPFASNSAEIHLTRNVMTIRAGEIVWHE